MTRVTNGEREFNVEYRDGIWVEEGTHFYYTREDWEDGVIRKVLPSESVLKSGTRYIHIKTGNPYTLITDNFMFKDNGVWRRGLCLYKTEYNNPDGEYFARTKEDFEENFKLDE